MIEKTAIIMLAHSDYESMEIALANYAKNIKENHKLFILQNGRNTYDCERTVRLGKRYSNLYPHNIELITSIKPQEPYFSIQELINSEKLKDFNYICKVDDDVFPLHKNWLEKLVECYKNSKEKYGEKLGYVTTLINNNTWGFKEILNIFHLKEEYFEKIAKDHFVGAINDLNEPLRIISKNEIDTGWGGTVWRNPYISRWIHNNTTLFPEKYLELTKNLGYKEVHNDKNYSINCMLFEKDFWNKVQIEHIADEYMILEYCRTNDLKIIADLSNPFVHLLYYIQREENRDLIPIIRKTYEEFLKLPYPIALCPNKEYEIENRVRELEKSLKELKQTSEEENNFLDILCGELNSNKKIIFWGASNFLRKLMLKYTLNDNNILGIIDSNPEKKGLKFGNYKIFSPDDIKKLKPDTIVVSIVNNKTKRITEIKKVLENKNINNIKII